MTKGQRNIGNKGEVFKVLKRSVGFKIFAGGLLLVSFLLGGCQTTAVLPTEAAVVPLVTELPQERERPFNAPMVDVPPTWTPFAMQETVIPAPTKTPGPTRTPQPTNTPFPTLPPTLSPTPLPVTAAPSQEPPLPSPESPTAVPEIPADPVLGSNLLPNGSFEEGEYNMWGVAELQLPVGWVFEWDEGPTGFGSEVWDVYVRPETRVLSSDYLPASEHALFIYDGDYTIKIFKGSGAISFKLYRDLYLEPGDYVLEVNAYPDLYMDYVDGMKIWADDPLTGQFRFIAPGATGWMGTTYGRKNTFTHRFTVQEAQTVRIGAAMRGNHAILNDGWFMDDWTLRRVQN
jgi:hypothetical protein